MRKYFFLQKLLAYTLIVPSFSLAEDKPKDFTHYYSTAFDEPGAILITPPKGWKAADPTILPPRVKFMIVGKGKGPYPPSINLGMEPYKGSTKDYLKMIKHINESLGAQWKDLGTVATKAGKASLSQVDMNTEWGAVRLMHVVIVKNRTVYVITAGALKNEFHLYYKDFFDAMKSIRFNPDVFDLVKNPEKQRKLRNKYDELVAKHDLEKSKLGKEATNLAVFESSQFQLGCWQPFLQMLSEEYKDMDTRWRGCTIKKFENDLTAEYE